MEDQWLHLNVIVCPGMEGLWRSSTADDGPWTYTAFNVLFKVIYIVS